MLNITINIDNKLKFVPKLKSRDERIKININDLKNTWNLKTAIIENEWTSTLNVTTIRWVGELADFNEKAKI